MAFLKETSTDISVAELKVTCISLVLTINSVALTDEESVKKYSQFQTTLKTDPNKDMKKEVEAVFKNNKVERTGQITAIGDYRAVSSYSSSSNGRAFFAPA